MGMDRRQFLRAAGAVAYGVAWLPTPFAFEPGPSASIAVVGAGETSDYGRGATLGIEEGERSAELLRRAPPFAQVEAPTGPMSSFVRGLRDRGVVGIVAALPGEAQPSLERVAVAQGLVVVDARAVRRKAAAGSGGLDAGAAGGVFRTGLPGSAYELALLEAAARAPAAIPDSGARSVLWHDELFRYGAQQLNDRYRRRFGVGMTGEAWAAWMGVKAVSEALLRARGGGERELLDRLGGSRAAFDGHKGVPLTFSGPDGTLAQPLYVVIDEETVEVDWPLDGGEA